MNLNSPKISRIIDDWIEEDIGKGDLTSSAITKKTGKSDNPQAQQMQMFGKVMPIFFGFISWTLPTGLVVYFLTGNIFRIGQQALIVKLDDREEVKKEEKKEENNEDTQSKPIQENPRKNRKKRRRK